MERRDSLRLYLDALMYLHDCLSEFSLEPWHSTFSYHDARGKLQALVQLARDNDQVVWKNLEHNAATADSFRKIIMNLESRREAAEAISEFLNGLLSAYRTLIAMPALRVRQTTPALRINQRERGSVTVLDLAGRITFGKESEDLRERIRHLLKTNSKQIVLNLENVSHLDSSGVAALISSFILVRADRGALKLFGIGTQFSKLFEVTPVLNTFEKFPNEAEAIASFPRER
jgi:anti-sigma B factor antagonist